MNGKYSLSWVHVLQCPAKGMCSCIEKLALTPLNARGYVSCKVTMDKWLDSTSQSLVFTVLEEFMHVFVVSNQRMPLGKVVFWQTGWWWWLEVNCSVSLSQFAALSQTPLWCVFNGNPKSVYRSCSATLWPHLSHWLTAVLLLAALFNLSVVVSLLHAAPACRWPPKTASSETQPKVRWAALKMGLSWENNDIGQISVKKLIYIISDFTGI